MSEPEEPSIIQTLDAAAQAAQAQKYRLTLYIAGLAPRSQEAIRNVSHVCEEYLSDRYELEVIDIYQHPELATEDQIVAVPTLIKKLPLPLRKIIGSMVEQDKLLLGLDLKAIVPDERQP